MRGSYVTGKQSEMNRKLGAKNRKKGKSGIESMQEKSIFKQFSVYVRGETNNGGREQAGCVKQCTQ